MRTVPRSLLVALSLLAPAVIEAQAWAYPSFQPPRVTTREFNFGIADAGGAGTSLLFQWREEAADEQQLSLDAGIADPARRGADLVAFVGGQYARQLSRSRTDVPLDVLFTLGAYLALGDVNLLRIPVGVSVGHRFGLEDGMALTPYVHPRLSLDLCSDCRGSSDIAISLDFGMSFDVTRTIAVRAAALFTATDAFDEDGFGVSIAWTPPGLSRLLRMNR
jgi:hypothetical protein